MYQPKPHEECFPIHPIGVRYICEFCNQGEMMVVPEIPVQVGNKGEPIMRTHRCTHCHKEMLLPKAYPYIEWEEIKE